MHRMCGNGEKMLAVERRNLILEKLQDEKKVVVSELSTFLTFLKKLSDGTLTGWIRTDWQSKAMAGLF